MQLLTPHPRSHVHVDTGGGAKVAVIGAGVSGLVAAWRLQQAGKRVTLIEASHRAGGAIGTEKRDGFLIEHGPDCFASNKPGGLQLSEELGLTDQLMGTNEAQRRSFILFKGKLEPLPEGFFLLAPTTMEALRGAKVLSWAGKLRLARELFIPKRHDQSDESLASFVERRMGRETLERIAQPIVAGIYSADPAKLSLEATFPQFLQMEREHGSVLRALRRNKTTRPDEAKAAGPRYGLFVSFKDGMHTLTDSLAARLVGADVQLGTLVKRIEHGKDGWRLVIRGPQTANHDLRTDAFETLVLALPAQASAKLLKEVAPELAAELGAIPYGSTAVANFAFRREEITHPLDGMGFVVPAIEGRKITGCSFSSVKFAGRAPENSVLLRVFLGGAALDGSDDQDDDRLRDIALTELRTILRIKAKPLFSTVTRHRGRMAQYEVGHVPRVKRIQAMAQALPGLRLAGNGFTGVGVPDCVRVANDAVGCRSVSS